MVFGHGSNLRDQVFANVSCDGFPVYLGGEAEAALGGVLMKRALKQVQAEIDLAEELFLADSEDFMLFVHRHA